MHMYNVLGKPSLVAYQLKSANFLSRTWDSVIRICYKFAHILSLTSILRNEGTLNDMAIDYIKVDVYNMMVTSSTLKAFIFSTLLALVAADTCTDCTAVISVVAERLSSEESIAAQQVVILFLT